MSDDYIPGKVLDYSEWVEMFVAGVEKGAGKLHVTPDVVTRLRAAEVKWRKSFNDQEHARRKYAGSVETAKGTRKELTRLIRKAVGRMRADYDVPEAELIGLGLRKYDRTPTPVSHLLVGSLPSPCLDVRAPHRGFVELRYTSKGKSTAKPKGIRGVVIYCGLDGAEMRYLKTISKSPTTHRIEKPGAVRARFTACWVDTRGRRGPFCDPVEIAVTGG